MSDFPPWLQPLAEMDGDREAVLADLFQCFIRDFQEGNPTFQGLPVRWDARYDPGTRYPRGFWQLISRADQRTGVRHFDPRRAERLPWCAPLLAHASDPEVLLWDFKEPRNPVRSYAWLQRFDYLVVTELREVGGILVAWLVTAYHVDGPSQRRSFRRKYERRMR